MQVFPAIGNKALLNEHKVAFLCSLKCPASRDYDWAIVQREAGNCVISGFHSQIEMETVFFNRRRTIP